MNPQDDINNLFQNLGLGLTTAQASDINRAARKTVKRVRRTIFTILAINLGCGLISLALAVCVVLGCLKLFGVI